MSSSSSECASSLGFFWMIFQTRWFPQKLFVTYDEATYGKAVGVDSKHGFIIEVLVTLVVAAWEFPAFRISGHWGMFLSFFIDQVGSVFLLPVVLDPWTKRSEFLASFSWNLLFDKNHQEFTRSIKESLVMGHPTDRTENRSRITASNLINQENS